MGRRKSRKAAPAKPRTELKLPTVFDCPFCNHDKSVECKMNRDKHLGELSCNVCGTNYQVRINYLSEPIDVYSSWIDKCEEVKQRPKIMMEKGHEDDEYEEIDEDEEDESDN